MANPRRRRWKKKLRLENWKKLHEEAPVNVIPEIDIDVDIDDLKLEPNVEKTLTEFGKATRDFGDLDLVEVDVFVGDEPEAGVEVNLKVGNEPKPRATKKKATKKKK